GATLYRCATAQPAFAGSTLTDVLRAVSTHQPRPPHEVNGKVPRPLSDLIMQLLAKAPTDRPQSAQEVADAFERLALKRRWPILLAAAAAFLFVATGGWGISHFTRPGPIDPVPPVTARYRGRVDVLVERTDADAKV